MNYYLSKLKSFVTKTNAMYDNIPEPRRFFTALILVALPLGLLSIGWWFFYMVLLIAWRMASPWCKQPEEKSCGGTG